MTLAQVALLTAVAAPWLAAVAMFALGERRDGARTLVGLVAGAITSAGAVLVGVHAASGGAAAGIGVPLLGVRFALTGDRLGALFAVVAAVLWLVTTVYATGYMSHAKDRARFFGFFAICVGSAIGIALSANLLTLFVFYEALTLATYPLVVHSGNAAALKGGRTYLYYALTGGTLLAVGVIWLYSLGGGADFAGGGSLPADLVASHGAQLAVVFALLIAGFGVKAALFPAHGWLPAAMVAPAPVSALLHAVAVVKAGVFGIARVVLDVYGLEPARGLGVLAPLAALAAFTIVFASVRALAQDDIKKRLAYSTIGQLSYIVLGLAIGTPLAAAAAIAHLAHHALLKITMFFTAGVLAEELKIYRVSQMDGVGRRMPLTMAAFTVAALGIIGVPPIAGFVSKWGLGLGGLAAGEVWPLAVFAVSSLLNAAYLMPMLGRAWFGTPKPEWLAPKGEGESRASRPEGDRRMVWPLALTAAAGLALGPLAGAPWAPATWGAAITGAPVALAVPWRSGGFGLDEPGVLFLVLAVVVWIAAAVSSWRAAAEQRIRYRAFFVLAAVGSAGLAFARDAAAFYACFSVMALAAYGLVAHDGSPAARKAARAYLAFTVLAEALLLAGLLMGSLGEGTVREMLAGSAWRDPGTGLLLLAFGIKIGALGLGGWMPAAYRAAPAGAGAALAGVVSTAGVLGMVRFLPGGVADLSGWGALLMALGLGAAFLGAVAGWTQREPRSVLAYSSMSQFGLMTVGVGAGLATAKVWPAAVAAVSIYLVHHGLAKAALFAGDDLRAAVGVRRWLAVALTLPALSLAGLPLTSGAIAKVALKGVAAKAPEAWAHALEILLPLAAVGTTLLMARFLVVTLSRGGEEGSDERSHGPRSWAFAALLVFVAGFLWFARLEPVSYAAHKSLTPHYLLVLSWPVVAGVGMAVTAWFLRDRGLARLVGLVPPGDLWARVLDAGDARWLAYQERIVAAADALKAHEVAKTVAPAEPIRAEGMLRAAGVVEQRLLTWPVASGAIALLLLIALALAR